MAMTEIQKTFAKAYVDNGGVGTAAYRAASPDASPATAGVGSHTLLKNPKVQEEIKRLLERKGLPRDFFINKMKDLADAQKEGKNGMVPDNSTQFQVMEMGMKMHGMLEQNSQQQAEVNVNYNLNVGGLTAAIEKLTALTAKLELSDCPDGIIKAEAEDADLSVDPLYKEESEPNA
jgi:phage terminase small subunit